MASQRGAVALVAALAALGSAACGGEDGRSAAEVEREIVGYVDPDGIRVVSARCVKQSDARFACDVVYSEAPPGHDSSADVYTDTATVLCDQDDCLPR